MAKKTTPIITHTEILARAIRSIEEEIGEWHNKCANFPQEQRDAMIAASTEELCKKLDWLKLAYYTETGNEYM